ncbi:MAG: hypothetical protein JWN93_3787 [Hyphomicrobiales bacterium]|nr:hypothetical protein [Hyphomicrobiales bacterium]
MKTPLAPVSWGELIDKVTILEIKSQRLKSPAGLANVLRELELLSPQAQAAAQFSPDVLSLKADLVGVNEALWEIEDQIREKEAKGAFDGEFIALARAVYKTNDERAAIKRRINTALNSELSEEKGYAAY